MKISILILFLLMAFGAEGQIITTYAGNGTATSGGDGGPATAAELNWPTGVCTDWNGNVYIAEAYGFRIRKVNSSGVISTYAGNGISGYGGDGGAATSAKLAQPEFIGADSIGNLYLLDSDTPRVRKVNTSGIITTIGGTGSRGYSGDGGPATAAMFGILKGMVVDKYGNVFVADLDNHRVRKINSNTGIITTIAGNGASGNSGDGGQATIASFGWVRDLAIDKLGNLYIRDDSFYRVRKVTPSGIITAVTGTSSGTISGDGGPASAASIGANGGGLAVDAKGNIYIVEENGNSIRKIDATTGTINTVIGNGTPGFGGDGGPASAATFYAPMGIAIGQNGNIYIADVGNMRVRYIRSTVGVSDVNEDYAQITLSPNPATSGLFSLNINTTAPETATITITNVTGSTIKTLQSETIKAVDIQLNVPTGLYFVTVTTAHGVWTEKVVVE